MTRFTAETSSARFLRGLLFSAFGLVIPVALLLVAILIMGYHAEKDRRTSFLQEVEAQRLERAAHLIVDQFTLWEAEIRQVEADLQDGMDRHGSSTERLDEVAREVIGEFIEEHWFTQQARWIDPTGAEMVRWERIRGRIMQVDGENLQDKAHRPYVAHGLALEQGEMSVSSFDLNVENGQIVYPPEPTIRFLMPWWPAGWDSSAGLLVFNVDGSELLSALREVEGNGDAQLLLVNKAGQVMKSVREGSDFTFLLPRDRWSAADEQIAASLAAWYPSSESIPAFGKGDVVTVMELCDADQQCADVPDRTTVRGTDFPWYVISWIDDASAHPLSLGRFAAGWAREHPVSMLLLVVLLGWSFVFAAPRMVLAYRASRRQVKAESLMQSFLRYNPSMVFVKAATGQYLMANDAFVRFCGKTWDEMAGVSGGVLFSPETIGVRLAREQEILETGGQHTRVENWTDAEGKKHTFMVSRFAVLDPEGRVGQVATIATDISEQAAIQKRLDESAGSLEAIFEASPYGLIMIDGSNRITVANRTASDMFGYTHEDFIASAIEMHIPSTRNLDTQSWIERYGTGSRTAAMLSLNGERAQKKDGSKFDVVLNAERTHFGDRSMMVIIVRDVTERNRMAEHLNHSSRMESIGNLAGTVAHDFNNFLGVIIGSLELAMIMDPTGKDQRRRIETALKAAHSGAGLTRRLLAISRRDTRSEEDLVMGEVIEELLPLLQQSLSAGVEIRSAVDRSMGHIFADRGELETVLLNLCTNARDAMPEGGRVTIEAIEEELCLEDIPELQATGEPRLFCRLSVSDTGVGMSKDVLVKVFEPFFTTKPAGKGTGLGMPQVHNFVTQTGGFVRVYSEVGKGTTIQLYFPCGSKDGDAEAESPSGMSRAVLTGVEHLLIVDDNEALAHVASDILTSLGYRVTQAYSGEQALQSLSSDPSIELVVTDIHMPGGMNGAELAGRIHKTFPEVRVLFASGSTQLVAESVGIDLANEPIVFKPYNRLSLARAIRKRLGASPAVA